MGPTFSKSYQLLYGSCTKFGTFRNNIQRVWNALYHSLSVNCQNISFIFIAFRPCSTRGPCINTAKRNCPLCCHTNIQKTEIALDKPVDYVTIRNTKTCFFLHLLIMQTLKLDCVGLFKNTFILHNIGYLLVSLTSIVINTKYSLQNKLSKEYLLLEVEPSIIYHIRPNLRGRESVYSQPGR